MIHLSELESTLNQVLAILLREYASAKYADVGHQNDRGVSVIPHRALVYFEYTDGRSRDVYIADPHYLAMDPPRIALREWVKDEDGVIIGEAHKLARSGLVDALNLASQVGAGGGTGAALALLQQALSKRGK